MSQITIIAVVLVLGISAVFAIHRTMTLYKSKVLKELFFVVSTLNLVWILALLLQLINTNSLIPNFWILDFILSLNIFICRFFFLFYYYRLIETILSKSFLSSLKRPYKIVSLTLTILYFMAWFEPLLFKSGTIASNLLIYTDILVFGLAIGGSIFLIQRGRNIPDKKFRQPVVFLGLIFMAPMILAFLKWILSSTLAMSNLFIERTTLHSLMLVFNILISIWIWTVKDNIAGIEKLRQSKADEFIAKFGISKREIEIIALISEGKTNKNIADILFISIETVKDHNSNIFAKTGVKNRTQLAKLFLNAIHE